MRVLKTFFAVLALVLISFASQSFASEAKTPQPSWNEMASLYGIETGAPCVTDFVAKYKLGKVAKGDSGSFSPEDRPYSIMFRQGMIECIIFNIGAWPDKKGYKDWTTYTKPLPFGLAKSDKKSGIIAKIGKPTHPTSDMWVYAGHSLMFIFKEKDASIESIYIWKEKTKG